MTENAKRPGAVVVGTGFGLFTHVRALRDAGFEVRALVGRNAEKTAERAARLEIPAAVTTLAEALQDPEIVLVTVATPPHAHYPFVMEAIAAGRHVMCEKPFARDLTEARAMRDAAEKAGVIHMLGAEFRFDTAEALMRRIVKADDIGEPRHFLRIYHMPGLQDPTAELTPWWEDASQGGGFLGAFGAHMIDQVQHMMGPITRVSGILQTLARGRPNMTADDCYSVLFETESGAKGTIMAALAATGDLVIANKLTGTKGGVSIRGRDVYVMDENGERQVAAPADLIHPEPTPFPLADMITTENDRWHTSGDDVGPYTRLFTEMKLRIAGETPDWPELAATFHDAASGQAVLDAIRLSAAEGRWVDVEQK